MEYSEMTGEQLEAEKAEAEKRYEAFKAEGHNLDMSRGKPSPEQLDLSLGMLSLVDEKTDFADAAEVDVRNYGGASGIKGARELMGGILGVPADNVVVLGNSSLQIMYQMVSHAMTHGIMGSVPWCKLDKVKFLCPAPGYDRHFSICEHFGIEMIPVPMHEDGPDMDMVEKLVAEDDAIKGIWCVPQYSNPQGIVYSDEVVERFAALEPAAPDFRIFWDNAYAVHHLCDDHPQVANLMEKAAAAGNPDSYYMFASTSKVTFASGGISCVAASDANIAEIKQFMGFQSIGPDKINQLRHVLFFGEPGSLEAHMKKQAELISPKFEKVKEVFGRELGGLGVGTWTDPKGGYFITFESLPGCAKRIVALAADAGVKMTGAGAMYPYKNDPDDKTIRVAPTYPSVDELAAAAELFCICVKIASAEKLLG